MDRGIKIDIKDRSAPIPFLYEKAVGRGSRKSDRKFALNMGGGQRIKENQRKISLGK